MKRKPKPAKPVKEIQKPVIRDKKPEMPKDEAKVLEQKAKELRKRTWERFKRGLKPKEKGRKKKLSKEQKASRRRSLLRRSLIRAGIETKPEVITKWMFRIASLLDAFFGIFLVARYFSYFGSNLVILPLIILATLFAAFLLSFFTLWIILFVVIDVLIYRRKVGIEEVLPDYLLLASANIRAGMPIDKALWYAVRPRFGVLAKEIETVAKETMSGEDLEKALQKFAGKYDSVLLKNTVSLLIEGINAGGEIAELLSKISQSIQENKLLRKEMAAGISAYAIFISVSAVIMAPLLYALSSQLLTVIADITSNIDVPNVGVSTFAFSGGGVGVTQQDFLIFAFANLFFTSLMSAMIVSIIRKGEIKAGFKLIPIYIIISMAFFYLAFKGFNTVFGSFI